MPELDDLLTRIETPRVDVAADVARGERALRRRRRWQVAATALSVAALAGVGVAVTGSHGSPGAQPGVTGQPGAATSSASARTGHEPRDRHHAKHRRTSRFFQPPSYQKSLAVIGDYRAVLADHLDPHGDLIAPASNVQSGGQTLGSKLDWNHGGLLEIVVGKQWNAAGGFYLLEDAGMKATTYDGQAARVSTTGDDTVVSVQHDDGTVVTLIASTTFGNNGTTGATTSLTQHRLLEAAADPRLRLPDDLG